MSAVEDAVMDDDTEIVEETSIESMLDGLAQSGRFEPGTYHDDIPSHLYHRGPGISKSGLDDIARSPAHYQFNRANPSPDTRATRVGHAFHCLLLEPHLFDELYVRSEYDEFRTKAAKEWVADMQAQGRFVLRSNPGGEGPIRTPSEWDLVHRMRDAVKAHPYASAFLERGVMERSMFWRQPVYVRLPDGSEVLRHELSKCRFDWIDTAHNVAVDVKTTEDASYTKFARSCAEYRYHVQREWYMTGQAECGHDLQEFLFLVVEKTPPYGVNIFTIPERWRHQGRALWRANLEVYSRCQELREWPTYPVEIRELELPEYAQRVAIS